MLKPWKPVMCQILMVLKWLIIPLIQRLTKLLEGRGQQEMALQQERGWMEVNKKTRTSGGNIRYMIDKYTWSLQKATYFASFAFSPCLQKTVLSAVSELFLPRLIFFCRVHCIHRASYLAVASKGTTPFGLSGWKQEVGDKTSRFESIARWNPRPANMPNLTSMPNLVLSTCPTDGS